MTTNDVFGGYVPPSMAESKVLRRSRTNRVAAGVSSGLGEYFGLDPVLFRVLFATAAFFGGAGILAYLLAWAAIPEQGTAHAPVDGWIAALRRRHIPFWLVAVVAGLILWAIAFSWWAPGPFFPVVAVVVLLVVFFGRREMQRPTPAEPISLTKEETATAAEPPRWVQETRSWYAESVAASRERRRRARPVRYAVLGALAVALITLAALDAISGIPLQVYFWTTLGIVVLGLLVGLPLRRAPLGLTPLLIPAIIGAVAFAGSSASFSDGLGKSEWTPTTVPAAHYRLAFGEGVLDLRSLPTQSTPRTVWVTMAAGQVRIVAPKSMNLTVLANVHIGDIEVDKGGSEDGGMGLSRTVHPPAGAVGAPITVDVHLADGRVAVERH